MLSRSDIKKAAAAFVGAVTMAVALPTALYANITVKADEPSELPVITQSTVTTTTLPASVYNSDLFKSYYSVSDTALVGSTIELETNSAPGVMFPDNMTFVEDGEVRVVEAEKLDNGKRKWKGNFIEFTVEKYSSVAVVTVLKKGMTDCLIGWGEENGYDGNELYPYNTFLHVDAMEKAEYEAYLEDLDRSYPTVQPTTAIGKVSGDSDYSYMFENGHEEGPKMLVGDTVNYDITVFHYTGLSFPDEMTVMEQSDDTWVAYHEPKTIKCEKLSDGRRRWTAECSEITYEEGSSTVEIKSLKEGETFFFLGEEERKLGDNDVYKTKAILYVESMGQYLYDIYIQNLDEDEKTNPTETPTYDSNDFYEAVGAPNCDLVVGEKTIIDVKDPIIDTTIRFRDFDPFARKYEPESETSKYFDVKKIGDRKYELKAKADGSALLCMGSGRKGYLELTAEQLCMTFANDYHFYMDGTDAEKSCEIDLADGYDAMGIYSWPKEQATFDTKHPFTVETVKYDDSTDSYVESEPEFVKIEPTDKETVYRLTALKEGTQFFRFTEESGESWIYCVGVTTHAAEEAEEEYRRTHPTDACVDTTAFSGTVGATNPADTVSKIMGDVNNDNDVSLADSLAILQHLANENKYGLTGQMLLNADIVDRGEGVTPQDALAIQKIDAKVLNISALPVKSSQL